MYVQKIRDPNVETLLWKRRGCAFGGRLTSHRPEHPHDDCRPLQDMGFLHKASCPASGMDPCLEVPLSRADSLGNHRAHSSECPTDCLRFSAVDGTALPCGVRHAFESQHVCRPHAEATCFSRLEDLVLRISGFKG